VSASNNQNLPVSHKETARRGRFHIGVGAELTYTRPAEAVMKVNHTLVDKEHRGKGLAPQLYRAIRARKSAQSHSDLPFRDNHV